MSLNALPSDLALDISQYLDGQSVRNFAQAWQPMNAALHGSQGTRARYKIELDQYGMVEGSIPAHIRHQPVTMLLKSLVDHSFGLSCLQWQNFEMIGIPQASYTTTWTGGEGNQRRNPYTFMGESGGCLYHALYDRSRNRTSLTILRFPSLRVQRKSRTYYFKIEIRVTAVAIDQHRDVVALLQSDTADWSALHFVRLSTGQPLREAYQWNSFWKENVEPRQFEILGDWVAMSMSRITSCDHTELYEFAVFNWKENYLWRGPIIDSFQFSTEDCLVILHIARWTSGKIKIPVSSISLEGDLFVQNIPPVWVDIRREGFDRVSFVRNAALPPKIDPELQGYFDLTNDLYDTDPNQEGLNGPYHSNPSTQLLGIKIEYRPECHKPPKILLFDRTSFINASARTPLELTGYFASLNGRRAMWLDPYSSKICVRDFNVNAARLYRTLDSVPHPQDPNWVVSAQAVVHPREPGTTARGWVSESSFVSCVRCPVQNPLQIVMIEDCLVVLAHGSVVGVTNAHSVALAYSF